MYLDHFGLRAYPFSITPDTELFYTGGHRGEILEQLLYAIHTGEGFIKLVGEVGSGKSILCRVLCNRLPETMQVALLLNPQLPPEELVPAILREFRVALTPGTGRAEARQALLDYLLMLNQKQQCAIIVIDEAQSMPLETLEELRLISNLETEQAKLLQIVLIGQPALDHNLRTTSISPLLERITTHCKLTPLVIAETEQYMQNRLWASGYRSHRLFSPRAVRSIHRASQGSMRQINLLAHKALLSAFQQGEHLIEGRHVMQAIASSEFIKKNLDWHRPALAAGLVGAVLAGSITLHSWAINSPFGSTLADAQSAIIESASTSSTPMTELPMQSKTMLIIAKALNQNRLASSHLRATDPLQTKIQAAHHWLAVSNDQHFTIQLMLLQDDASLNNLEPQLTGVTPAFHESQVKIFRLKNNNLMVFLHEFASMQEGLEALQQLPEILQSSRPRVRQIKQVKQSIQKLAQHPRCVANEERFACTPNA